MSAYVGAVWSCRYFWLSLVKMDLRTRYRGSALGIGWSLLQPIAMTIVLGTVFSQIFGLSITTFAPFLMAGLTFWSFLGAMIVGGCQCFFQGEGYIRQFPAPMAIYPLRTVLAASFHFGLAQLLVVVLGAVLYGFHSVWPLLTLLPTYVILLIFGWSMATLFGLANVRFRDTHHLSEIVLQILFYMTPVMYTPDLLDARHLGWAIKFNPLVPFLDLLRAPVVEGGKMPNLTTFLAAILVTAFVATAAAFALKSEERKLIFHL